VKLSNWLILWDFYISGTLNATTPPATTIKIKICCNNNKILTMDLDGEVRFPFNFIRFVGAANWDI